MEKRVIKTRPGRKRKFPEGVRNQIVFTVDDDTFNRFIEAKDVLQNSMPEALKNIEISRVDAFRGLIEFFLNNHDNKED